MVVSVCLCDVSHWSLSHIHVNNSPRCLRYPLVEGDGIDSAASCLEEPPEEQLPGHVHRPLLQPRRPPQPGPGHIRTDQPSGRAQQTAQLEEILPQRLRRHRVVELVPVAVGLCGREVGLFTTLCLELGEKPLGGGGRSQRSSLLVIGISNEPQRRALETRDVTPERTRGRVSECIRGSPVAVGLISVFHVP